MPNQNQEINSMASLEKFLGVRFFKNLSNIARKRLSTMDDATGHIYGSWLMEGISNRHPLLGDEFRTWFMESVCGERLESLINPDGVENVKFDGSIVFQDLFMALSGNTSATQSDERTLADLRLLEKVWTGQNMSVSELIALIEEDEKH